ncbi:MAG: hypothetical protein ACOC2Y_07135 [Spirochaetota bacterium]
MAKRFRFGFVLMLLLFAGSILSAQSNDMIDSILGEETATVGSAAYVALTAAGLTGDETGRDAAVEIARERGWLTEEADAGSPVTFGEFAFMLMEATEVGGGLMYIISPGPRYAAREFVYRGWSPERTAPGATISGQFLIRATGNFLDRTEVAR